jgi:hypothetical protein
VKTTLINSMKLGVLAFAGIAAVSTMIGCGGGSQTRTADQWQQEVGKEIDGKTADLRACYRNAGASAKTSVPLTITATPSDDATATLSVAKASAVTDPSAANSGALGDCVSKALQGLPLPAGDSNVGDGAWKVTFDPSQLDPTAPVPPAAPAGAAPPSPPPAPMPKS